MNSKSQSTSRTHLVAKVIVACVLSTIMLSVAIASIITHDQPIRTRYIYDDNFRGICKIVISPSTGTVVPLVNGVLVFTIPPGGILKIKSEPRSGWETPEYVYKSGAAIPQVRSRSELTGNSVAFVYCGKYDDGTDVMFVGSKIDADRIDWSGPLN